MALCLESESGGLQEPGRGSMGCKNKRGYDMSCLHFVSANIRPSRCVINNYMCVLSYYSMNDISSSLFISSFFSQNRFDASLYILYRRKKTGLENASVFYLVCYI